MKDCSLGSAAKSHEGFGCVCTPKLPSARRPCDTGTSLRKKGGGYYPIPAHSKRFNTHKEPEEVTANKLHCDFCFYAAHGHQFREHFHSVQLLSTQNLQEKYVSTHFAWKPS